MTSRPNAALNLTLALCAVLLGPGAASAADIGKLEGGNFVPGRAGASRFGADPDLACPRSTLASMIQEQAEEVGRATKREVPRPDGRLCAMAETFLGWDLKEPPSEAVVTFVSQHFGLPLPTQRPAIVVIDSDDPSVLSEKILQPLGNFALAVAMPRYGFATRRIRSIPTGERGRTIGQSRVVLVVLDASLALDPVPRRLAAGEKARLAGSLVGGFENPRLSWSDASGALSAPTVPPGKTFAAEVACGDRPGLIRVDIRGERDGAQVTLGRFPIACGTDLPTSVALAGPEPWPGDTAGQERKMLEAINGERESAGLPPLGWDDALAGVARDIASDTRDAIQKGNFSTPGDVLERLKKVGIATAVVVQNPGLAASAQAAFQQLAGSPPHRANMLNKEVNKAGIGVVMGTTADGKAVAVVDQLFIKDVPAQDLGGMKKQLLEAVGQKRKDSRQPPLAADPALDEVAGRFASEMAASAGELPKARRDEILAALNKGWKTVHMTPPGAKADPLDFAEEPEVTAAGKFVGVGVAKGMHPTLGRNALYVTILVGAKR
jgi:uncharacterized protein YkwD